MSARRACGICDASDAPLTVRFPRDGETWVRKFSLRVGDSVCEACALAWTLGVSSLPLPNQGTT